MRKTRFWVGAVAFTSLGPGILIATSVGNFNESGRVEGRVIYNGRPLRGGSIMFVSQDRRRSDDKAVRVDETGYYDTGTDWRRDHSARTRFRICVLPDADPYSYDPPATENAGTGATEVSPAANLKSGPAAAGASVPIMVPPPMKIADGVWRAPDFKPFRIRPFSDVDRTHLAVELGGEPARVNIDVND